MRRDYFTTTTPEGKTELAEEELSRATVGAGMVKFKFTTTTKDKVDTYLTYE